mmetsp:Transcript_25236/g.72758  ORF Transcript_25236/g.72758 Transcript_25236/m.72758 type:complete len:261 (-) Transcript_25236:7-789(-)
MWCFNTFAGVIGSCEEPGCGVPGCCSFLLPGKSPRPTPLLGAPPRPGPRAPKSPFCIAHCWEPFDEGRADSEPRDCSAGPRVPPPVRSCRAVCEPGFEAMGSARAAELDELMDCSCGWGMPRGCGNRPMFSCWLPRPQVGPLPLEPTPVPEPPAGSRFPWELRGMPCSSGFGKCTDEVFNGARPGPRLPPPKPLGTWALSPPDFDALPPSDGSTSLPVFGQSMLPFRAMAGLAARALRWRPRRGKYGTGTGWGRVRAPAS